MNGERSGFSSDEEVLLTMYAEHGEPLLNDAMDLTSGDRQRAQALVREALLRAWRNPDAFDSQRESPRERLRSVLRGLAAESGSAVRPEGPAHGPTGGDTVEQGHRRSARNQRVIEAVRGLVPTQRTVLLETHYRGRNLAETAEALGVPVGTVKSRLYHALTRLHAELAERDPRSARPEAAGGTAAGRAGAASGPVAAADTGRGDETRTRASGFDPARLSLGAYVLGKLAPDEALVVAAHLATCTGCRAERDALAEIVPLLGTVSEADVMPGRASPAEAGPERTVTTRRDGAGQLGRYEATQAQPGGTALEEMHQQAGDEPLRAWRRPAAVLALVVVVAAVTWLVTSRLSSPGTTSRIGDRGTRIFRASDQASGVRATVTTAPTPWGSEVRLDVSGIPSHTHCTLVAVGLEGSHETAASWLAGNGTDTVPIPGAISKSVDTVAHFEVDTDSGPLLSITTS
ncbi:sigma factor-like helix-turn-helix DNA-binding protein [Streptomyces sp. NPDC007971]|uniref:sigma factor-like helix-turn-helix DNA-binding protein n=1 Tax=Streptomyces sp. NPDC007971 TaxID=3364799 RepID=UPI0036EE5CDC